MSKITFLKSFDGNFEETAQFNTISKIVDMIFLYISSFFLLVLVVIFRALCDAFSSREKKFHHTDKKSKPHLRSFSLIISQKFSLVFRLLLFPHLQQVQNQLSMYVCSYPLLAQPYPVANTKLRTTLLVLGCSN